MFFLYNVAKVSYWISSSCNYIIGGLLSYLLNKKFTFRNGTRSAAQVFLVVLNAGFCHLISYSVSWMLSALLPSSARGVLQGNLALLLGMGFYTVLNYAGQRFIVFRKGE